MSLCTSPTPRAKPVANALKNVRVFLGGFVAAWSLILYLSPAPLRLHFTTTRN